MSAILSTLLKYGQKEMSIFRVQMHYGTSEERRWQPNVPYSPEASVLYLHEWIS